MKRIRKLSKWADYAHYKYKDASEFSNSRFPNGVHTIPINGTNIDILTYNRRSPVTLIVFHAALSKSATRIPAFKGRGLAEDSNFNLISLADPTLEMGELDVAWFLGNEHTGYLPDLLAPLLHEILRTFETQNTIIFGSSGGGFAAVNFGSYFPDSIVLAAVPRLSLVDKPVEKLEKYASIAFSDQTREDQFNAILSRIGGGRLSEKLADEGLNFDLCIYHNLGDKTFADHHVMPFISKLESSERLFTKAEWFGSGHVIIPAAPYRQVLSHFGSSSDQKTSILSAGFVPVLRDFPGNPHI